MKIIIYGSQYGTARKYAEEFAKRTNIEIKSYKDVTDIDQYNTVVYIGSLYAGGVLGMKKTLAKILQCQDKKIIIATVGLAAPADMENTDNIKNSMKRQLSKELYENAYIFHLRGGIDYSRLNFKHKAMIETYNQKVNFVDFEILNRLTDCI